MMSLSTVIPRLCKKMKGWKIYFAFIYLFLVPAVLTFLIYPYKVNLLPPEKNTYPIYIIGGEANIIDNNLLAWSGSYLLSGKNPTLKHIKLESDPIALNANELINLLNFPYSPIKRLACFSYKSYLTTAMGQISVDEDLEMEIFVKTRELGVNEFYSLSNTQSFKVVNEQCIQVERDQEFIISSVKKLDLISTFKKNGIPFTKFENGRIEFDKSIGLENIQQSIRIDSVASIVSLFGVWLLIIITWFGLNETIVNLFKFINRMFIQSNEFRCLKILLGKILKSSFRSIRERVRSFGTWRQAPASIRMKNG